MSTTFHNRIDLTIRPAHATFVITGASLAAYALSLCFALSYMRDGALDWWRIFTCHFCHWNSEHLFWSVGTFAVLGYLSEQDGRTRFLTCIILSAVAIPVTLWLFDPALIFYGGLSGVDCALFMMIAASILREKWKEHQWTWVIASTVILGLYAVKIGFELYTGGTVFVQDNSQMLPVPLAHIAGGAVGAVIGFTWAPVKQDQS